METLIGYIPYIVAVGSLIWLINLAFKRKANGARIAVICFVIAVGWISLAVLYVSGFDFVLGQAIFYISNIVILTLYIIVRNRALPAKTPVSSPAENVPENTGGSPPTARTPPATRQFSVDAAVATPCGLDASGIDTVRCSKCGTVQRSDRKVCYSCGEQFILSKDNAARKESLEAESDKPLDAPLAPPCTPPAEQQTVVFENRGAPSSREQFQANVARWKREAGETAKVYPGFDFVAEQNNPETGEKFMNMVRNGVHVQSAYEVVHINELAH